MDEVKRKRTERENNNRDLGIKVDVDFQVLVEQERDNVPVKRPVSLELLFLLTAVLAHSCLSVENLCLHKKEANLLQGT